MINAKDEFVEHTRGCGEVLCAEIKIDNHCYNLREGYSQDEYDAFLASIDIRYDNGWGDQLMYGTIWYRDGTYSARREWDMNEWWEHLSYPVIPDYLKQ
jgi:hypothetical protein